MVVGFFKWVGGHVPASGPDRRYKTRDELHDDQVTDLRRHDELSAKGPYLLTAEKQELDKLAERIVARARLMAPVPPKPEISPELLEADKKFRQELRERDMLEELIGQ